MPFNLSDFVNNVLHVQRTNQFELLITPPQALSVQASSIADTRSVDDGSFLKFLCNGAVQPTFLIETEAKTTRYGIGLEETFPSEPNYKEFIVDVVSDGEGVAMKFFEKWLQYIVPFGDADPGRDSFEVKYKDDYASTVELKLISPEGFDGIKYTFYKAFPTSVTGKPFSWTSENEYHSFNVTFDFFNMSVTYPEPYPLTPFRGPKLLKEQKPIAVPTITDLQEVPNLVQSQIFE